MAKRPDTLETLLLALELLRRIPRKNKITARELQEQLQNAGMDRDLRTIQRMLETFSEHFEIERDDRSKPYGFRWQEASRGMAVSHLTPQESLLLQLAQEHLRNLLPPRLMQSMSGFFDQARRNLDGYPDNPQSTSLEREWQHKVRVVATSQPLLPPTIAPGVLEEVSEALYANRWLELLIRRELFMRPHRRHACRQSTSGPALACSPTSSCVLSPPRAAWPWFAPEPCCQSHASNRH